MAIAFLERMGAPQFEINRGEPDGGGPRPQGSAAPPPGEVAQQAVDAVAGMARDRLELLWLEARRELARGSQALAWSAGGGVLAATAWLSASVALGLALARRFPPDVSVAIVAALHGLLAAICFLVASRRR